jgi:hypothetical protein
MCCKPTASTSNKQGEQKPPLFDPIFLRAGLRGVVGADQGRFRKLGKLWPET